ncbi:MAG: glycoside hydrolase family 65 protein [Clostridia bacterium]|nr:glycoside hydrolase family 65 protein [Clostridia bacterium]
MDVWSLSKQGDHPEDAAQDGNRFLAANGYMGLRGVPEEAGADRFPAVTLAGVYDRFQDRWREPVNAPNGLFVQFFLDGLPLSLGKAEPLMHSAQLHYQNGVYHRRTEFDAVLIESERFASLAQCHLLADRYQMTFRRDGELTLYTGISTEIWDINGPHLFDFRHEQGEALLTEAVTGEKHITVAVAQAVRPDFEAQEAFETTAAGSFRVLRRAVRKGETLTVALFAAVYTSLDHPAPGEQAARLCLRMKELGFAACLAAHEDAWADVWRRSLVELTGDEEAARALHASQYHLNSIAPRHSDAMSIPARGLSGQTYKGAIFWDSEIFFFPMFAYTQPEIARVLLKYRIDTLPGARQKAASYGYRGAFYAWESQEGGQEGCTDFNVVDVFTHRPVRTYFRDKQIHISGDIAYALRSYYEITGDRSLLEEGGAKVILECARFYISRASARLDGDTVDLNDVIGPDEYHERVANSAFTNAMALHCLKSALMLRELFADRPEWFARLLKDLNYEQDWALIPPLIARIRRPRLRDGVIEQFDGYFELEDCSLDDVRARLRDPREYWGGDHGVAGPTQIIKQADVIALLALFPGDFTDREVADNWQYYEPRTEHGSSLSACMYALTACRIGKTDEAWELFLRTANIDVSGSSKQWAGEIYIGGTHPAANGGAWMIAALGFAGLRIRDGRPELHPSLPRQISRLRFPIVWRGERLTVEVTREGGRFLRG